MGRSPPRTFLVDLFLPDRLNQRACHSGFQSLNEVRTVVNDPDIGVDLKRNDYAGVGVVTKSGDVAGHPTAKLVNWAKRNIRMDRDARSVDRELRNHDRHSHLGRTEGLRNRRGGGLWPCRFAYR